MSAVRAHAIRVATRDDAPRLSRFLTESFVHAYGTISPPEDTAAYVARAYAPAALRDEIERASMRTYLAHDGEAWAGCAQVVFDLPSPIALAQSPHAEVQRFYLHPDWHGSGVAAALMDRIKADATARGARALWLSAWQHAAQAIRFYEKQRFAIVGEAPSFVVGNTEHDDFVMAWLAP